MRIRLRLFRHSAMLPAALVVLAALGRPACADTLVSLQTRARFLHAGSNLPYDNFWQGRVHVRVLEELQG